LGRWRRLPRHSRGLDVFLTGKRLLIFTSVGDDIPNAEEEYSGMRHQMNNSYLEVISLVERLHRQFMEVMKLELEGPGVHDINNVQAMMLFNIGDVEMTVGDAARLLSWLERLL
jgi:hypothetical protein